MNTTGEKTVVLRNWDALGGIRPVDLAELLEDAAKWLRANPSLEWWQIKHFRATCDTELGWLAHLEYDKPDESGCPSV